jgi:hypothetical protein
MNQLQIPAPASCAGQNKGARPPAAGDLPVYDLARFTMADMVRCGAALRRLAGESASMEEAAQRVTRYLYDHLCDQTSNQRCCALARLFRTLPYSELDPELRACADSMAAGASLVAATGCLTLLASAGDEPQWNSRRSSRAHQCIPLISAAMVEQFPMIAQLIRQFGVNAGKFLPAGPEMVRELEQKNFGVFHVPSALGSPFVPAQEDFVAPYRIGSVLGVGGVLPDGKLFALILFARVSIPVSTAEMFRTIALNLKLGFLELLDKPVLIG